MATIDTSSSDEEREEEAQVQWWSDDLPLKPRIPREADDRLAIIIPKRIGKYVGGIGNIVKRHGDHIGQEGRPGEAGGSQPGYEHVEPHTEEYRDPEFSAWDTEGPSLVYRGASRHGAISMLTDGIRLGEEWYSRPPSVYFFAKESDAMVLAQKWKHKSYKPGFASVVVFEIPEKHEHEIVFDAEMAVDADKYLGWGGSAFRIERPIPPDWIKEVRLYRKRAKGLDEGPEYIYRRMPNGEIEEIEVGAMTERAASKQYYTLVWITGEEDEKPVERHASPIHPGTGTDQQVHGGDQAGGAQSEKYEVHGNTFEDREPFEQATDDLNLDQLERVALHRYSASWYGPINRQLRSPESIDDSYFERLGVSREKVKEQIAIIDDVFERASVPMNVRVFRGINKKHVEGWEPGDIVSDSGFVSTTMSEKISPQFAFGNGVLVTIDVPKGSRGIFLGHSKGHLGMIGEVELLLDRDSRFKVISANGGLHLELVND